MEFLHSNSTVPKAPLITGKERKEQCVIEKDAVASY